MALHPAFDGKVALVLGASAKGGTGWAIAESFARNGAKVVVAARRIEPLEALAASIGGIAISCDATNPEDIGRLVEESVSRLGRLDIAVNSAAMPVKGHIAEAPIADVQRSLDVNFLAQVNFVRETAARMEDGGAILLISSASAVQPLLPHFPYACAKAAADTLVRYAALEYGPRGIRVNSILPGPIKTELAASIYRVPGAEAARAREIPLGRVAMPEDIAEVAVALASCNYLTGLNLPASGGMHLTRPARADELLPGA
jgi:NAD(P)-dependent dehydrogenase (short-subunit alcohol dehydrogenase family)